MDGVPPWEVRSVINEIKMLSSSALFSFVAVRLSANKVGNWMAKRALHADCIPHGLSILISKDISSI